MQSSEKPRKTALFTAEYLIQNRTVDTARHLIQHLSCSPQCQPSLNALYYSFILYRWVKLCFSASCEICEKSKQPTCLKVRRKFLPALAINSNDNR